MALFYGKNRSLLKCFISLNIYILFLGFCSNRFDVLGNVGGRVYDFYELFQSVGLRLECHSLFTVCAYTVKKIELSKM